MKISKAQAKEQERLAAVLASAASVVEARLAEVLRQLPLAEAFVNDAINAYNTALVQADAFASSIAEDLRSDFDERSESWQEGDAGQEAETFISEWEGFRAAPLPPIAIIEPELEEKLCHAKELRDLPTSSS